LYKENLNTGKEMAEKVVMVVVVVVVVMVVVVVVVVVMVVVVVVAAARFEGSFQTSKLERRPR
jgi:heme/copper-type cytochrome/quinol oxidase subunit 2